MKINTKKSKMAEGPLMNEGEFKDYISKHKVDAVKDFYEEGTLHLVTYDAIGKCKSIRRAIKRGRASLDGVIYPKRPFNNKKYKKGSFNEERKRIYEQIKYRRREAEL